MIVHDSCEIQTGLGVLNFYLLNLASLIENELMLRAGFNARLCRKKYRGAGSGLERTGHWKQTLIEALV